MPITHIPERRRLLKKKRAAENALRADRVKSIEQEVEEFVTGPLTELAFSPTDKEWRAIQLVEAYSILVYNTILLFAV